MIGTAPLSFDRANEQVEGMIRQGTSFARVEDAIDAAEFSLTPQTTDNVTRLSHSFAKTSDAPRPISAKSL